MLIFLSGGGGNKNKFIVQVLPRQYDMNFTHGLVLCFITYIKNIFLN